MVNHRSSLAVVVISGLFASWCVGQQPIPQNPFARSVASGWVLNQQLEREQLALELAKTAAENGSQELSLGAFKRFMESYSRIFPSPTAPRNRPTGIQSSLLGTQEAADPFGGFRSSQLQMMSAQGMSGQSAILYLDSQVLLGPIFDLVQTWKTKKFDAGQVADVLQQAVLPAQNSKTVQMMASINEKSGQVAVPRTVTTTTIGPNGTRSTTTTTINVFPSQPRGLGGTAQVLSRDAIGTIPRFRNPDWIPALGFYLIDWAAAADRLPPILTELESRAIHAEGQDAHALIIYGYRSQGDPQRAAEYVSKMLAKKEQAIEPYRWVLMIQAAMQPLAKDEAAGTRLNSLSAASATLPNDVLDKLLEHGLRSDFVGVAPYYQQQMRRAIETDDVKWLNALVPKFIQHFEAVTGNNGGNTFIRKNVWTEVVNECIRINRPYMALRALAETTGEKQTGENQNATTGQLDESRLKALLALCDLPIEKRMVFMQSLLADESTLSLNDLHFYSFPECTAPIYFRSPAWQNAARLLQADPNSGTISLLDLLLSDAETQGKLNDSMDILFAQLPSSSVTSAPINRLVCEWASMRADMRGVAVPERIATENVKLSKTDFKTWFLLLPENVQSTLAAYYQRKPDSAAAKIMDELKAGGTIWSGGRREQLKVDPADQSQWTSTDSLKHWLRLAVPEPPNTQAFAGYDQPFAPWRISDQNQLSAPRSSAALMLKYPLEGNYTLRCKVSGSGDDWSNNSLGGIINGTFLEYRGRTQSGTRVTLATLNGRLTSSLSSSFRLSDNPQVTDPVDVECLFENNRVGLSINGKSLAHSEFTSHSFPFVGLLPMPAPLKQGSIEIVGSPKVASQVNLLDSSFSGWSSRRYDRLLTNVIQLRPADQPPAAENPTTSQLASWKLEQNELRSEDQLAKANTSDTKTMLRMMHNCMLYARPLLDGERFEYEVWTDKDTPTVAPVMGLTAMLIEEGKIRLHWLPTSREVQVCGIAADNRSDDPQAEQLSAAKLSDNQWNKIALRIEGNRMMLNINGTDIYRRPIPANNTTEFGWLCNPDQPSVRIRNATLKGNWPDTLPEHLWEQ